MIRPTQFIPLEIRNPLDASCVGDMERIAPSHIVGNVEEDLTTYPLSTLEKRYPEFTFGHQLSGKRPKDKACSAKWRGGWRWAAWRTA